MPIPPVVPDYWNYGKFQSEKKKKEKEARKKQLHWYLKELRFRPQHRYINDYDFKLKHAKKFLEGRKTR